jgi:DNA-binding transcriptional LysR family regulator
MLDVTWLSTLREVARQGSFSKAAQVLALTQPAVSRQIALLERQVRLPLVTRSRRGVQLTEAGRVLVEHTEMILGRISLAEAALAELAGTRRRHVRLGAFLTALAHLAPELKARAERRYPDLLVDTELLDRTAAMQRLLADDLDLAIVHEHDFNHIAPPPEVVISQLFDEPLRVILPAGHQLAHRRELHVRELADETWIQAREGTAAQVLDHLWKTTGIRPTVVRGSRGDELMEAQGLVAAGLGIAISHSLGIWASRTDVVVRRLVGGPQRHVQAALLKQQRKPAVLATLKLLEELGAERGDRYNAQRAVAEARPPGPSL